MERLDEKIKKEQEKRDLKKAQQEQEYNYFLIYGRRYGE